MNVSLTPTLEEMIRRKVDSGLYNNASEVVREALRLLDERDKERRLREELAIGLAQLERGQGMQLTDKLVDEVRRGASEDARLGRPFKNAVVP